MANFSPLTADIYSGACGTPANFNGFRYCSDVAHRWPTKLHDVWPSPGLVHYIFIFGRLLPPDEILPGAKFTLRPSCCLLFAALLHGTPAAGVSQTLRRGTRNGSTELSQRTPPIFDWAAITMGIGPHSSLIFFRPHIFRRPRADCRDTLPHDTACSEIDYVLRGCSYLPLKNCGRKTRNFRRFPDPKSSF